MKIERFDILMIDLNGAIGTEQQKIRPCVVVGNEIGTKYAPAIIIMPLTHVDKKSNLPTHGIIRMQDAIGLKSDSMILGEQPRTVDRVRIKEKLGQITNECTKNMVDRVVYNSFFLKKDKEVVA